MSVSCSTRRIAFGLFGVIFAVIACTGPGKVAGEVAKSPGSVTNISGPKAAGTFILGSEIDGSTGRVSIQGLDTMRFTPNSIVQTKPNTKLEIEFTNTGSTIHNIVAPGMGLATPVKVNPRQKGTAMLTTPASAGTYQFWCSEPGHAEAGMIGQVVVSG